MKRQTKLIFIISIVAISLLILLGGYYLFQLSPVSKDEKAVEITIENNATGSKIAQMLEDHNLIRSEMVFRIYLRIHGINNLKSGVFELSPNMGVKKIASVISTGKGFQLGEIGITFPEGKNMRQIATIIALHTNNTEEDVMNVLNDKQYLNQLIEKYWFISDDIKNPDIYYSLEGYLAPDTYRFNDKDVTVKEIFNTMLDQTNSILSLYKAEIESMSFTAHEFLTLASIVEAEGLNEADRPAIAGVFYNRLDSGIAFGSCVTACYAGKVDDCIPKNVPTKYDSPYNTYLPSLAGKLPIGPVSNPGEQAIEATINPEEHDYLYFVSDINKNVYFSRTNSEHEKKVSDLKEADLYNF